MYTVDTEQYTYPTLFELIDDSMPDADELSFEEEAADVAYDLGIKAMRFARRERVPRYDENSRENDSEHSFMLSLVAPELAADYYSDLDIGLVTQFSVAHDLIELETGDVATFTLDDVALANKEATEHLATDKVARNLPVFWRQIFLRYEQQLEAEARFVRLVDKVLPVIVDIAGPGRKVMEEDYDIYAPVQLDANEDRLSNKLRERFPDKNLDFIHHIRDVLAARFSEVFASSYCGGKAGAGSA